MNLIWMHRKKLFLSLIHIYEEDNFSITEDKTLLDGTILTFFKDAKGKEAATEASEVAYRCV